jgi:hypothetical protein
MEASCLLPVVNIVQQTDVCTLVRVFQLRMTAQHATNACSCLQRPTADAAHLSLCSLLLLRTLAGAV